MGNRASFPMVPFSRDHVVIVTGANTGIGYEIAKQVAMMGATVIIACRSEDRAKKALLRMQEEFQNEKEKGTTGLTESPELAVEFMKVDLGSFKSVVQFCEEFRRSDRKLHALVCNAGIAFGPFTKTEDGLEAVLQVNYLSQFIMIAKLLHIMKNSGPDCRLVLVTGGIFKICTFDLDTMNYNGRPNKYPALEYYARSKLYQVMQTFAMDRRLKGSNISINTLHPGVVTTELGRNAPCYSCCKPCMGRVMRSPLKGATCAIDLTVNPKHAGVSGHYWVDCEIKPTNRTSQNIEKQEALWQKTLEFVKEHLTEDEIKIIE